MQARDYVIGSGDAVRKLRCGGAQYVAERGRGEGLLQAGDVIAGIRIGEALGERRRRELRNPGGLVEESVAAPHREPPARAQRLPREAEARRESVQRRGIAVLTAGGSYKDSGGRRAEGRAGLRGDQRGVAVG